MSWVDPDAVKRAVSLLDVVRGDGHALRRSGSKFWMLCFYHDEKTPSCIVNERRFHCFGCGVDGDLLDYIQLRDGCEFPDAVRKAAAMAGLMPVQGGGFVPRAAPVAKPEPWMPYRMNETELQQCVSMADTLLRDRRAVKSIAVSRKWRRETIRRLAMDACLGLHGGNLVYLYATGAKKRFKPLTPALEGAHIGPKFAWMFGKPDAPWRIEWVKPCTDTVHITEGETSAITLVEVGIDNGSTDIAIAVPGASCWRAEWGGLFRHKRVVIWPDADEAGAKLMNRMLLSLAPHTRTIDVVSVPGEGAA